MPHLAPPPIKTWLRPCQQEKTLKERFVNEGKKRNAEINQQLETIRNQLYTIHYNVQPPTLLENAQQNVVTIGVKLSEDIKSTSYQSIRLAKLDYLIGQPIFLNSNALVTPIATFGGFAINRRTRSNVLDGNISHTSPQTALEGIEFQCAFCNVCIPFAKVNNDLPLSSSPKCTIEFLAKLSTEHKAECRALKGAHCIMQDDVQFGISEGSSDIEANIKRSGSTQ